MLDEQSGNKLWQEAEAKEIKALMDYKVFKDLGKNGIPPPDYKKIRCHMVYDVKHDGRHKGRLVAGGHLTPVPTDSVYSGVISLCALRLVIFLAELNKLQLWGADVSSAYLEADTKEKVYLIAGDEFGKLSGNTLIIEKALYGLCTSGLRWHEKFADVMRDIGLLQSQIFGCEKEKIIMNILEFMSMI
jgi:Reverse transcriptase (RNA-dependent DNA polymerase)